MPSPKIPDAEIIKLIREGNSTNAIHVKMNVGLARIKKIRESLSPVPLPALEETSWDIADQDQLPTYPPTHPPTHPPTYPSTCPAANAGDVTIDTNPPTHPPTYPPTYLPKGAVRVLLRHCENTCDAQIKRGTKQRWVNLEIACDEIREYFEMEPKYRKK